MMFQLLYLLFLLGLLLPAGAQPTAVQELYVKPTEDTSCPEPCHTLDEYVQNATQYFVSNTVFKFLPGTHSLSQSLTVSGVSNLTMVGSSTGLVLVNISCSVNQSLSFTEISNLTLEDLTLSSCGLDLADLLNVSLLRISLRAFQSPWFDNTVTMNAKNILGTSSFTELSTDVYLHFIYNDDLSCLPPCNNQLTIKDSTLFKDIETAFNQTTYSVSLHVRNLTLSTYAFLSVDTWSVAPNYVCLSNLQLRGGGGVSIADYTTASTTSGHNDDCTTQLSAKSTRVTIIENSVFSNSYFSLHGNKTSLAMKNVTYSNFKDGILMIDNVINMSLIDCKILNNDGRGSAGKISTKGYAVIVLFNSRDITFTDCEFSNNIGTPIAAVNSQYTMSGSTYFINNSAYAGGAMAFYGQSYVTFTDGADIWFVNNSAVTVGGAIYVDSYFQLYSTYLITNCFFRLQGGFNNCDPYSSGFPVKLTFTFIGNNAANGGSRIYGALLDTCIVNRPTCLGWKFADPWFHFDPRNASDFSGITSDPLRVCLCEDGRPSCTAVINGNRTYYPGEIFNLSAVVVGDRFGTVDGSVYAQILPVNGIVAELEHSQSSQHVEHQKCTNISYTIFSNDSAVTIALTASSVPVQQYPSSFILYWETKSYEANGLIRSDLGHTPVYVNVTLLPCPLGFHPSGDPPGCVCDTQPQKNHISCDLSTQTFQRSGTEWINASFHGNSSNGVIVSKYCPNNYCKPETLDVNLENPDTQCAFLHSGILCGGCQSGLSLALGSAQCLPCSNAYLALLIPFALAGLVLVFFIKLLNLTVAQGTLNGLIFYANIVGANQVAWIPSQDQNVLRVFIAWLNLDLGIETCFFDGLDAYWKTWLQFVFPLYIWAIAILIIVLSHYFSTAAKIFGNNSVPTLATLFLLSYPKLLRTIISIFHFSTLDYPDGTIETVWSYDGNIPYFSPKHIPLLLVAMAAVVFLWLPYTGTLMFAQCLQRSSNYRVGKIFAKLKPFLDAYFGPLKDKHRYWVGLLLLVRGILLIVFAATPMRYSDVNLVLTLVAVVCIMLYLVQFGNVYKHIYLSLLENSFFLNLGILAGGTPHTGNNQSALANTSVGIAFTQFVVIVFIHAIIRLKETQLVHKLCHSMTRAKPQAVDQANEYDEIDNEQHVDGLGALRLIMSYGKYREPVLKYLDSPS